MTETMIEIMEDVGFEHWDEVERKNLAEIVHNLAAGVDQVDAIANASDLVVKTFLRYCDTLLERDD